MPSGPLSADPSFAFKSSTPPLPSPLFSPPTSLSSLSSQKSARPIAVSVGGCQLAVRLPAAVGAGLAVLSACSCCLLPGPYPAAPTARPISIDLV